MGQQVVGRSVDGAAGGFLRRWSSSMGAVGFFLPLLLPPTGPRDPFLMPKAPPACPLQSIDSIIEATIESIDSFESNEAVQLQSPSPRLLLSFCSCSFFLDPRPDSPPSRAARICFPITTTRQLTIHANDLISLNDKICTRHTLRSIWMSFTTTHSVRLPAPPNTLEEAADHALQDIEWTGGIDQQTRTDAQLTHSHPPNIDVDANPNAP